MGFGDGDRRTRRASGARPPSAAGAHRSEPGAADAYGIAEPANIATAPAIVAAVYNAIGVRLRSLPMMPMAVLAALGKWPPRS